jgi:hypothetical protein
MMTGNQIAAPNDPLQKAKLEQIVQAIRQPPISLQHKISQLRLIKGIDARQYQQLKKGLPYFVCSRFHPPHRKKENFAATDFLILDLDHLSELEEDLSELKNRLRSDPNLLFAFVSPGGDGLKLLFRLTESCHDPGLYKLFYQAFAIHFARQYQLEKVVDFRTNDVTRACFFSSDPEALYFPEAQALRMADFMDQDNPETIADIRNTHQTLFQESPVAAQKPQTQPLDDDILRHIKQQLNPSFKPKTFKNAFVPEQLEARWTNIEAALVQAGFELKKTDAIQYGKKIVVSMGSYQAELNIFYGKKGFTVVKTTRNTNHADLMELAYQTLHQLFNN